MTDNTKLAAEVARLLTAWTREAAATADGLGIVKADGSTDGDAVWDAVIKAREAARAPKTVEVRVPKGGWVKRVKSVKPTAKTGYDWDGPFLGGGKLVDLASGRLVVWGGGDDDPVELGAVQPDGSIDCWTSTPTKYEWAIRLRA